VTDSSTSKSSASKSNRVNNRHHLIVDDADYKTPEQELPRYNMVEDDGKYKQQKEEVNRYILKPI